MKPDESRGTHFIYIYGQQSADGWACRACLWEGDIAWSRDEAQEMHDAGLNRGQPLVRRGRRAD